MAGDIYVTFGGDTAGLEASLASAKASVNYFARELAALSRAQIATGASADSELGQKMLAVAAQLTQAKGVAAGLKGELGGLGKEASGGVGEATLSIGSLGDSLRHMAELAGIAFSVEALKDWIAETAEAAEKIEQMSAKLGATPEQVQSLGAEAKLTGTDFEEMATQLERLQLSLAKAGEKASPAAAALKALGIDAQQFRALSPVAQVDALAESFSRYADGASKTAIAQALLGRAGADMIPFLDKGAEGMRELNDAAQRTGVIMSGETISALAQTREHINEMSLAWQGLSQKIYAAVNPAIDAAVQALTRMLEKMDVRAVQGGIEAMADGAIGVGATVLEFAVTAEAGLDGLIAKIKVTGAVYAGLVAIASPATAAMAAAAADMMKLQQGLAGGGAGESELAKNLREIARGAEDARAKLHALMAPGGGDGGIDPAALEKLKAAMTAVKPQAPQMQIGATGADEALKDAEAEASAEVDAFKNAAKEKEQILDEQLKTHQLSMSQWLGQTVDALADEAQDVKATYDAELQIAGLTSAQKINIAKQEANALAEIHKEVQAASAKAAEQTAQQWQSAMNTINSAVDGQIKGLLTGTENWHTAFKNVLADLTVKTIEFFVNAGLQEVENTAKSVLLNQTRVAAHVTGDAEIVAADQSAASAGLFADLGAVMKSIEALAGQVAAAVAAFMAPLVGPAAVPVGAAAGAAVIAMGQGGIGAMDIGAWDIPEDQLSLIHKNELVMPAAQAGAFRDMLEGGGPAKTGGDVHTHVNVNVATTDLQSFDRLLHDRSDAVLSSLQHAAKRGGMAALRKLARG